MNGQTTSVRGKIARLRAAFVTQLPGRMAEARRLCEALLHDPHCHATAVELHRLLHNVKGTGGSFGFAELSTAAAQAEKLAAHLLERPGSEHSRRCHELSECLSRAESCAAAIQNLTVLPEPDSSVVDTPLPLAPSEDNETEGGGRLIYVCDDEALLAENLSAQINCFGYQAVGFIDLEALRQAMFAKRPDALIMDISFPQGRNSGTELVRRIRGEIEPPVPTIFLSARDDFDARLQAVQAGGEAYFQKPARTLDLVASLDELTQQRKPEPFRILVVDDEPEVAAYHSLLLQEAGMLTHQVREPARVMEALHEFRPDLVLMDMYMPGCNGHELAKLIRQMPDHLSLPIVYLSSETDKRKQFSAMRVGAEGFLTKPIQPADLVEAVAIRAERMRELRMLMMRDSLTGLFNHTTIFQLLENALAAAGRQNTPLSFAMIDMDHFKSINDNYGHPVGDQVLLALARVLRQRLRHSDMVGRYGGEEFVAILPGVSADKAVSILDQLRGDFAKVRFQTGKGEFTCSFSAGVASFPQIKCQDALCEAADKALYQAKRQGRNRVTANFLQST